MPIRTLRGTVLNKSTSVDEKQPVFQIIGYFCESLVSTSVIAITAHLIYAYRGFVCWWMKKRA
jgi:hypothetical protein